MNAVRMIKNMIHIITRKYVMPNLGCEVRPPQRGAQLQSY